MPAPTTIHDFLDLVRKSGQIDDARLDDYLVTSANGAPASPRKFAMKMIHDGVMTSFQAEQFLLGKHKGFRLGIYRIIDRLGAGGAGLVYLAEHEVIKKRFAIKVLPQACADNPCVIERFRREARVAALLDHPNVVQVYDFREENGLNYIVMEYIEGQSLQQLLQRRKRLAISTACEYARQAALGLQHAHELGLVHRDVKPGNVMVDPSGTIKVLDLGLARYHDDEIGEESLTQKFNSQQVLGTADYLSPEQALSLHNVDGRADIYSLGATLFTLLTGKTPFSDRSIAKKLMMHQTETPALVHTLRPEVPQELSEVIAKMLAKKPCDRFATAGEVAVALEQWAEMARHTGLQPSNQTLGEVGIDPFPSRLDSRTGTRGGKVGLAPDTVMAIEGDTLSLRSGEKTKSLLRRGSTVLTPETPSPVPTPMASSPPQRNHHALMLALVGLGFGLAMGLIVGAVGLSLLR